MPQPSETFGTAVDRARQELPGAFTIGGSLPFNGKITELSFERAPESAEPVDSDLVPTGNENLADFEEQHRMLGFEAIAFYIPFHRPTPNGEWGIFYFANRVRQFGESLRRKLRVGMPVRAANLALEIIRRHELFHFRFDVYALHQELTAGCPLYNHYSQNVYAKVRCTSECFEEALANRASAMSDWNRWDRAGISGLTGYLKRVCKDAPPGYRDFDLAVDQLRAGLGGQLIHGRSGRSLTEPQAQWVGHAGPFEKRAHCPEYILTGLRWGAADTVQFRIKEGGRIWDFHKYDPDPWPSTPHGHDVETGWKLNLKDGRIYDPRNRRKIGQENANTILSIRSSLRQKWPEVRMDPLDPQLAPLGPAAGV